MTKITRFEISQLHGFKNIDLHLKNNILVLVGENGAGKTTVLNLLYYLLSGQWSSISAFQFKEIAVTIDDKRHAFEHSDLTMEIDPSDFPVLSRIPTEVLLSTMGLIGQEEGLALNPQIEEFCMRNRISLGRVMRELELFGRRSREVSPSLSEWYNEIRSALDFQLLYLPTYRRIEQELNLIFKGMDQRELRNRREMLIARREGNAFVELVEFGMKDVDNDIARTLSNLTAFAREGLNDLTFGYLGDIVNRNYMDVNLTNIREVSSDSIGSILNRIDQNILSNNSKRKLQTIISDLADSDSQSEHTKFICHYFSKLMAFQKQLETKESQIASFCDVCNKYMSDKEFKYDTTNFKFSILSKREDPSPGTIQLHQLSSGEKQIVSLFSHLYLSGEKDYFVLIDEPELSLSVSWQRRFLMDIHNGSFFHGLVAVTHSPFIYDNELRRYASGLGEFTTI